jgi:hypothetical protein
MTKEQLEAFSAWLKKHAPAPKCPACTGEKFDFGLVVAPYEMMPPGAAGIVAGVSPKTAVAQLICSKCGCSLYFDAQQIGIPLPK